MSIRKNKIRIYSKFFILKTGVPGVPGVPGMFKVNKQMWARMVPVDN